MLCRNCLADDICAFLNQLSVRYLLTVSCCDNYRTILRSGNTYLGISCLEGCSHCDTSIKSFFKCALSLICRILCPCIKVIVHIRCCCVCKNSFLVNHFTVLHLCAIWLCHLYASMLCICYCDRVKLNCINLKLHILCDVYITYKICSCLSSILCKHWLD